MVKNGRTMLRMVSKCGRQAVERYDMIKNIFTQAVFEIHVKTVIFYNFAAFWTINGQKWLYSVANGVKMWPSRSRTLLYN